MSDGNIAPVIAGLAAGVALILVFSIFVQNALVATTRLISAVIIPEESSIGSSGNTFEPREIRVVIGYNNTVRWINHDSVPHFVEANTMDDPVFWNTTVNDVNHNNPSSLLQPNDEFEFTFEKAGEFGYHSKPWMQGRVVVLPSIPPR